jgi:hypothetical protein
MKKYLFLFLIALFTASVTAQDAMLTKEETVNYINKKLQELEGRDMSWANGSVRFSDLSFRLKKDDVELKFTETSTSGPRYTTYVFNPGHISSFDTIHGPQTGSAVRAFSVKFPTKTGRWAQGSLYAPFRDVDYVQMPYFDAIPGNRKRLEKALLHLRDLYRAEDEPFGN